MYSNIIHESEEYKENNENCFITRLYDHNFMIKEITKFKLSSNTYTFMDRNKNNILRFIRKNPYKLIHLDDYMF
jgi:hypothetical protein|tara:strand:+ start:1390 stop:1611 length:222 start_codon:yes stop_codon:yes gene_type:complete